MPCCCQTNLQATFVLGIISLVFGGLSFIFENYGGGIGIVVGICYIVGAKSPNPSAILVGMIFACIECVAMIIFTIHAIVLAGDLATATTSAEINSIARDDAGLSQNDLRGLNHHEVKAILGAAVIVGVVYTVGVVIFQIWTIIVANKARKEIDEGIRI